MSKSVEPAPAIADPDPGELDARARRELRETRREATVVLTCDVARR